MLTPLTAMNFVPMAYFAAILCTILVEIHPRGRLGRVAAYAAIAFVSAGGAAWSYAAFYERYEWPEFQVPQSAEDDGGAAASKRSAGRGGEIDSEDGSDGNATGGGNGRREAAPTRGATAGGSGRDTEVTRVLGLAAPAQQGASATIIDCDGCPPMIAVPAGSARIGADDKDTVASAAERPQRDVRFWPGYLISAEPVSDESFQAFMAETGRRIWSCGPQTAALDLDSLGAPEPAMIVHTPVAGCVMPGDADAYTAWLSARTGKSFRLPSAAEWEYAARVLGPAAMATGRISELVADCWHSQIPQPGRERIASEMGAIDCDGRMLKGAAANDDARWHRLAARRQIGARETRAAIGFRVMRRDDRTK